MPIVLIHYSIDSHVSQVTLVTLLVEDLAIQKQEGALCFPSALLRTTGFA